MVGSAAVQVSGSVGVSWQNRACPAQSCHLAHTIYPEPFCCTRQGVDLVRAEYIPDDIDDIRQTVLRLKDRVGPDGVIFSSGGIGPTHDDVTYAGIASAFGMLLPPSNHVIQAWCMVLTLGMLIGMHVSQTV